MSFIMDKVADWEDCPDCDGKGGCSTCGDKHPGYILVPKH